MENSVLDQRYIYLNRNSGLPLYYQLKEHIKDAILKGQYKPNDKLPTEEELCRQFSVSRPVVRQAYAELIKEGLVGRRKGSGTFVKPQAQKNSLFKDFINFSLEKSTFALEENSQIVKVESLKDETISNRLSISPNTEFVHMVRTIQKDQQPFSIVESYLPGHYFLDLKEHLTVAVSTSVIDIVEKRYGIRIQKAIRSLSVVPATAERAALLGSAIGELTYEVETAYYDAFDRIAILENDIYLVDKMKFTIEITRK